MCALSPQPPLPWEGEGEILELGDFVPQFPNVAKFGLSANYSWEYAGVSGAEPLANFSPSPPLGRGGRGERVFNEDIRRNLVC
jgi:hypothetical protein